MNREKVLDALIAALNRDNIQNELKTAAAEIYAEYVAADEVSFPCSDYSERLAQNKELQKRLELAEEEKLRLDDELSAVRAECDGQRKRLLEYEAVLALQLDLRKHYLSLSSAVMRTVKGIFKDDSMNGLLVCGTQYDNLCSLRNYTEQLVINSYDEMREDISALDSMFTVLLSAYNSAFSEPPYALADVHDGDRFDDELHFSLSGKKSGDINGILLTGLVGARNGRIIRRTLVR